MAKSVKPIKTAVRGLGRAGWNIHVKAVRGRKEFEIIDMPQAESRIQAVT